MKIKDMLHILNAKYATAEKDDDKDYNYGFASDMMSDVLAYANDKTVLITGLNNPQVIRTAEMLDISLVVMVRGKHPSLETIKLAEENNITIIVTNNIMFKTCGVLYEKGMEGI